MRAGQHERLAGRAPTQQPRAAFAGAVLAIALAATASWAGGSGPAPMPSSAQAYGLALAPDLALAGAPQGAAGPSLDLGSALDAGWQEAVISVRDAAATLRFLREVAGWRLRFEGTLAAETLDFYAGTPGRWPTAPQRREWLVTDADGKPGFVRLVAFGQPEAPRIRSGAMPWDTGGILSLMTRSNATATVYRAAQDLGWTSFNDPVVLDLREAGVQLTNVVLQGPDGIVVSVYERLQPRTADAPDLQRLRRPFNAMQSVRDIGAARAFYVDVLGFEVLDEGRFDNDVRAPNNFGVPANLVIGQPLRFVIAGPQRTGPTQIELVAFPGVEGRDLARRAQAPNLGILALRFPVSRLDAVVARLRKAAWPIAAGPAMLDIHPYGRVRVLAVRAPDGAWLEFFERIGT